LKVNENIKLTSKWWCPTAEYDYFVYRINLGSTRTTLDQIEFRCQQPWRSETSTSLALKRPAINQLLVIS
jgi:hypothetical protein